ncbi:MAG: hypothetical protein NT166_11255 [Candidatus Aminicenantes bacterium]|nr:hypothetical protein [Candidatus Aminicenantes bacterium]
MAAYNSRQTGSCSICPGALLQIAIENELTADSAADNGATGESLFKNRLKGTLTKWQEDISFVSFATAFEITRKIATDALNPLLPPTDENKKALYDNIFQPLTLDTNDHTEGKWPWAIMREKAEKFRSQGAFPPRLILIGDDDHSPVVASGWEPHHEPLSFSFPKLPTVDNGIAEVKKKVRFSPDGDEKNKASWEAYGVIPSLVADDLRVPTDEKDAKATSIKKTRALIYLLGTRSEFVTRWYDRDWGMIIGLTADARDAGMPVLKAILDSIAASWNLLAVAPFAIAQAGRIGELDAQQKATHIFKTEAQTLLDTLNRKLDGTPAWLAGDDPAINDLAAFRGLLHLSHFLAKRGLRSPEFVAEEEVQKIQAIKINDLSKKEYKIVEFIKKFFNPENRLNDKITFNVEDSTNEEREAQWVNKRYITAVLNELIQNIIAHAAKENEGNPVCFFSVKIKKGDKEEEYLSITLKNEITREDAVRILEGRRLLQKNPGINQPDINVTDEDINKAIDKQAHVSGSGGYDLATGEAAATAFFNCLGGQYTSKVDLNAKKYMYCATMTYNLSGWQRAVELVKKTETESEQPAVDFEYPESKKSLPREAKSVPLENQIALRVLLLDDYMAEPGEAYAGLCWLEKQDKNRELMRYKRSFPISDKDINCEFQCFGLYKGDSFLGLEIVLCTRLQHAKEFLATVHFDILLVDVDFGREPSAPSLGGILFALIPRPYSVVRIMTAVDSELRQHSRDYMYLTELQSKKRVTGESVLGHLEIDTSDSSKQLSKQLRFAFLQWLCYVFPNRVDPINAYYWTQWLNNKNSSSEAVDVELNLVSEANAGKTTLSGEVLRAINPADDSSLNLETDKKSLAELKAKIASSLMNRPTAVCYVLDCLGHDHKEKYLPPYANDIMQTDPTLPDDYNQWKKKLDFILDKSLDDEYNVETFKQAIKEADNSGESGLKGRLDNLFRHEITYNGESTKIYRLCANIEPFKNAVTELLGEVKLANKIIVEDKRPRCGGTKCFFVGLFLIGNKEVPDASSGTGTISQMAELRKYVSFAHILTVGKFLDSDQSLPSPVKAKLVNFGSWNGNNGKVGLVLLMFKDTVSNTEE